jgi:hypothetical protein
MGLERIMCRSKADVCWLVVGMKSKLTLRKKALFSVGEGNNYTYIKQCKCNDPPLVHGLFPIFYAQGLG